MKILILNGPNLNKLKMRNSNHYGVLDLNEIEKFLQTEFPEDKVEMYQSNHEGELIEKIQGASKYFDGLIINPGGFAHTSVSIRDALELLSIPKLEVHLSNIACRENFRNTMLTASVCNGYISGFKELGYYAAIHILKKMSLL